MVADDGVKFRARYDVLGNMYRIAFGIGLTKLGLKLAEICNLCCLCTELYNIAFELETQVGYRFRGSLGVTSGVFLFTLESQTKTLLIHCSSLICKLQTLLCTI